jgi:hypothetical protein
MKILVSGCARSGTTLMTHLMRYFYNTDVMIYDEEHPFRFTEYTYDPHLVIKKPAHQSSHPDYFSLQLVLDFGWKVIWMIRDGRDVISSMNGYVPFGRWIDTNMEMLSCVDHPNLIIVSYEQMVGETESTMNYLSESLGLEYDKDYQNYYSQVDPESKMNKGSVEQIPIHTDRIGVYDSDIVGEALRDKEFIKLQKLFGYGV